jgi:hypothetical protein
MSLAHGTIRFHTTNIREDSECGKSYLQWTIVFQTNLLSAAREVCAYFLDRDASFEGRNLWLRGANCTKRYSTSFTTRNISAPPTEVLRICRMSTTS